MRSRLNSDDLCVVPYVGTWIEINEPRTHDTQQLVVPYVGTWIEI